MEATVDPRQEVAEALYTPLLRWETRLLLLHPSEDETILTADLVIASPTPDATGLGVSRGDCIVEYEALSYTWGPPDFPCSMVCNGLTFPITANLYEALIRLKTRESSRYLWIDAICINQFDATEKARQVGNLFAIFRRASKVTVWLGEATASTHMAFEFADSFKQAQPLDTSYKDPFTKRHRPSKRPEERIWPLEQNAQTLLYGSPREDEVLSGISEPLE